MPDETEIFTKPAAPADTKVVRESETIGYSHFFKLSIKASLALILITTVCMHSFAAIVIAVLKAPSLDLDSLLTILHVNEPLYTMSGMALAYYFGQQKQLQQGVPPTPTPK